MFPSIGYTGRLAGDPLGMMTQGDNLLKAGLGSQKSDVSCDPFQCAVRWGDYSSMSIDPSDDCTFWSTNEYPAAERKLQLDDLDRLLPAAGLREPTSVIAGGTPSAAKMKIAVGSKTPKGIYELASTG
jgi:hypothetical protein